MATPATYVSSQARGPIRSYSCQPMPQPQHAGTKPHLWPTPQLTATPDPWPTEWGRASNPILTDTSWILFYCATMGTPFFFFFSRFLWLHLWYMEVPRPGVKSGATAASFCHDHSNVGSKPHLWSTLKLRATPDPQPTKEGQRLNLHPHGY